MLKAGITGGIGVGKSYVSKIFSVCGVPIYNADKEAKSLYYSDDRLKAEIKNAFGEDSYKDGKPNFEYLSKNAFANEDNLKLINSLIHPKVKEHFENWLLSNRADLILKEAALLYESGSFQELDLIIVVHAPLEIRIERVLKRDPHRSPEDIKKIIGKQMSQEEKVKKADFVIINDGSKSLVEQIAEFYDKHEIKFS